MRFFASQWLMGIFFYIHLGECALANSRRYWLMGAGVAVVCAVMISAAVSLTSRTSFCLSCHEMRVYHAEIALSSHAKDADGKEIGCSQCHIPNANVVRMLAAKTWLGLRDVWMHNVHGGMDLDRAAMQPVARRFTDDANCRACHLDLQKNARNGPISPEGRLAHANYLGENGKSGSGCVGCHINLAHLPVFDERIPANQKFAAKMKENRS